MAPVKPYPNHPFHDLSDEQLTAIRHEANATRDAVAGIDPGAEAKALRQIEIVLRIRAWRNTVESQPDPRDADLPTFRVDPEL